MNYIGKIIKDERVKSNLTQKELAKKAEISNSFLCDIEKGRSKPAISTLYKIALALKIEDINIFLPQIT